MAGRSRARDAGATAARLPWSPDRAFFLAGRPEGSSGVGGGGGGSGSSAAGGGGGGCCSPYQEQSSCVLGCSLSDGSGGGGGCSSGGGAGGGCGGGAGGGTRGLCDSTDTTVGKIVDKIGRGAFVNVRKDLQLHLETFRQFTGITKMLKIVRTKEKVLDVNAIRDIRKRVDDEAIRGETGKPMMGENW